MWEMMQKEKERPDSEEPGVEELDLYSGGESKMTVVRWSMYSTMITPVEDGEFLLEIQDSRFFKRCRKKVLWPQFLVTR